MTTVTLQERAQISLELAFQAEVVIEKRKLDALGDAKADIETIKKILSSVPPEFLKMEDPVIEDHTRLSWKFSMGSRNAAIYAEFKEGDNMHEDQLLVSSSARPSKNDGVFKDAFIGAVANLVRKESSRGTRKAIARALLSNIQPA
jgi:hypothetical protein